MATGLRQNSNTPVNGSDESPLAKSEPDGKASTLEIVLPSMVLVAIIVFGLLILAVVSFWPKWKRRVQKMKIGSGSQENKLKSKSETGSQTRIINFGWSSSVSHINPVTSLITEEDEDTIVYFETFQNTPLELVRIAVPALLTILICPISLLLYRPVVAIFWPADKWVTLPKVNDVIQCFLTPAGLIYAITFGFAFQEAMCKHAYIMSKVAGQVNLIEQIINLVLGMRTMTTEQKVKILKALKEEMMGWMRTIPKHKVTYCPTQSMQRDGLWKVVDTLQEKKDKANTEGRLESSMTEQLIDHVLELDNIGEDRMGQMHSRIKPLQWIFLELLGFFAFFGILLIRADSYRLELAMCTITIFSISIFCYVLSDLDSPFHGAFRVKLSILPRVARHIDTIYSQLCSVQTDGRLTDGRAASMIPVESVCASSLQAFATMPIKS